MSHKLAVAAAGLVTTLVLLVAAPVDAQYAPVLSASTTTCRPGQTITLTGSGFPAGREATLTLLATGSTGVQPVSVVGGAGDGVFARSVAPARPFQAFPDEGAPLGTAAVTADGTFVVDVTIPTWTPLGTYLARAVAGDAAAEVQILVTSDGQTPDPTSPPTGVGAGSSGSSGPLPRTGSDLNALALVGAALLVVGGLWLLATRKRGGHSAA